MTLVINLLFTAASLLLAMPLALSLQKAAVDVFLDTVFASYLNTVTPGMILFAFLFFAFDGNTARFASIIPEKEPHFCKKETTR